jgi:tripartite-type tricarboxylate transporter receptor subunit TctC
MASLACAIALSMAGWPAAAQQLKYPLRPIRFIVPYPAGGSTDIVARTVATKVSETIGQQVVVDNRGGANTIVGADIAAKAVPDGHTILLATATTLVINPVLYRKLPYATREFAPITQVTASPYFLVGGPALTAKTVQELVAQARSQPGRITYASTGLGSTGQMGAMMIEQAAGVSMVHVPYKGNAPTIVDLIAGQVQFTFVGLSSVHPHVKTGKLRLVAFANDRRSAIYPEVPTLAESGFPGFWIGTWFSIVTQAGVPRPFVERLNREIVAALRTPDAKERLEGQGFDVVFGSPEDLARYITEDTARWSKIAQVAKISLD